MSLITRRGERFEYYEAEEHRELFSVTQVRQVAFDTYAGLAESVLEPARIRGSRLHRRMFFALASLDGVCAYPAVLPDLEGYCASMDRWIAKRNPIVIGLERAGLNRRYGYAGTRDALLLLADKKSRTRRTVFDLKTGAWTKTDAMQLCAYEHMDNEPKADDLLDLYLDKDGRDAEEVYLTHGQRATEWAAFLNALNLLKWRTAL